MILIILTRHISTENNEVSITHKTRVRPISFYESATLLVGLVLSINIVQKHVMLQIPVWLKMDFSTTNTLTTTLWQIRC